MTPDEIYKLIPDEVVEAAARVLHANAEVFHDVLWDDLGDYDQGAYRDEARAAIAAALTAWPVQCSDVDAKGRDVLMLVFPLAQKDKSDE